MRRAIMIAVAAGAVVIALLAASGRWSTRPPSGSPAGGVPPGEAGGREPLASGLAQGRTHEQERELERIATLGYIAGVEPVPDETGVVRHVPDSTYTGYTLYTCAEGSEALLIDMDGRTVFRWSLPGSKYWARARLLNGGDLLVITCDPYRMMKLNSRSEVVWRYGKPAHHDFDVLPNGTICVLVREAATREGIHGGSVVLDDVIALLDPAGHEFARVSLLDAFARSGRYAEWTADAELPDGPDVLHTNSIQMIEEEGRLLALVSIRAIDAVAAIDMRTREVLWAVRGPWHMQHEAQIVDGNLLVFDNLGLDGQSRVLEFDGRAGDVLWSYTDEGFLTKGAGAQQRLPNGNTLITESEKGRIIEVTRSGAVAWEYINPATTSGGREAVLGIMRSERIPGDHPLPWAPGLGG
jgi:hypothetical protein